MGEEVAMEFLGPHYADESTISDEVAENGESG
jgi:hypothetical protein